MIKHAIILAAGFGSRLDAAEGHKVLAQLGDRSLLEYHVHGFARAGIERVSVVSGYRSDLLAEQIDTMTLPIPVTVKHNPEFEKSNGFSVIAGWNDEPAWLTMGDHLFAPSVYDRLPGLSGTYIDSTTEGLLVIDRKIDAVFDLPDATKLRFDDDGQLDDIGKEIEPFCVVDCGLFYVTEQFIEMIKLAASDRGDCSTSDAVIGLCAKQTFRFWDLEELLWQDVDTPGAREHAEKLLREWN